MITFSTYKDLDPRKYKRHEIDESVREALIEFSSYQVTTFELCGCYIAIEQIQFADHDEATIFRLKYSDTWKVTTIPNEEFKGGHRLSYVGG